MWKGKEKREKRKEKGNWDGGERGERNYVCEEMGVRNASCEMWRDGWGNHRGMVWRRGREEEEGGELWWIGDWNEMR